MTSIQVIVIATLGAVTAAGIGLLERKRKQLPQALQARPELQIADIYSESYSDLGTSADRFEQWWRGIAEAFEVPPGRIRPADRFGVELPFRPIFGITDEDLFLYGTLKKRVGRKAARQALPKLETVDQFIRFLAEETRPTV